MVLKDGLNHGFYRPQRSWAKVMFLQASVILSTGGGSASVHAGMPDPPQTRHPPGPDPPRPDTPHTSPGPGSRPPPPGSRPPHPGKQMPAYGQCAAGTLPTGMHSCITLGSVVICLPCYFQCEPTVAFESPRAPIRPVRYMYQ